MASGPTPGCARAATPSKPAPPRSSAISSATSSWDCPRATEETAMQFGLTETQQVLKNSAREFFSAVCPIAEVRRLMETAAGYDAALWQKMAPQGWTCIIFDEEYGGRGLGLVEMAVALEEMGRALLPGPYLSTVLLAGVAIDAAGNPDRKSTRLNSRP